MIITPFGKDSQFDLPIELKLNIEMASPIFSKAGAMSLPVSLPLTDKNRRLLQFPDRLDIYDSEEEAIRTMPDIQVLVTQGSWQQAATMSVSGCSEESVEVTLYFNESNIWARLEGITIPQVMAGKYFGTMPPAGSWIDPYRELVYEDLNNEFQTYSPLTVDQRENDDGNSITYAQWKTMHTQRADMLKTKDFLIAPLYSKDGWLNSLEFNRHIIVGPPPQSEAFSHTLKETEDYQNITAFLRMDYIIHEIFAFIGLSCQVDFSGMPDSDPSSMLEEQWHCIVVVNNTKDALYPGCMYYSALVPDISCKEFLLAVMAQFGCVYTLNGNNITIRFINGILKLPTCIPIKQYDNRQISFNTSADYNPSDGLENIDEASVAINEMPSLQLYSDMSLSARAKDRYPELYTIVLDGLCQRTTTTTTNGEDTTADKKCPLIFARFEMSFVWFNYHHGSAEVKCKAYYPCLRETSIEYYHQDHSQFDARDIQTMPFKQMTEGYCSYLMNNLYLKATEKCDNITLGTVMSMLELLSFDFAKPYVLQGRLCWPYKLQLELQPKDKQNVTIEFIAPKNLP